MPVTINGTSGITTPGLDASGTNKFATTIGVGGATPAASGAGITFPAAQSASSNANTLDDYEEGDWTPTLVGTVSNPTVTYTSERFGRYIKIGKMVFVEGHLIWSSYSGGNGNAALGNLPFTHINANWADVAVGLMNGWTSASAYTWVGIQMGALESNFVLVEGGSGKTATASPLTNWNASGGYIRFSFCYETP